MLKKVLLSCVTTASLFALHNGELNINDKDLEVGINLDIGQFNENVEPDTMFIGGKFFNPDVSHSSDDIGSIDPYFEMNFLIMKEVGNSGMELGFGTKLNYGQMGNTSFSTLPIGLEFAYTIPAVDLVPMKLHGALYYAPEVLSFSNADDYLEYKISYDVEFIENVNFSLGYRSMNVTYTDTKSSINYNSSWYLGVRVGF